MVNTEGNVLISDTFCLRKLKQQFPNFFFPWPLFNRTFLILLSQLATESLVNLSSGEQK